MQCKKLKNHSWAQAFGGQLHARAAVAQTKSTLRLGQVFPGQNVGNKLGPGQDRTAVATANGCKQGT